MIKTKHTLPHSPEWRVQRRQEMQRRAKIRDCDGNERLAPGPLPDPDLERSIMRVSTVITEREIKAFMALKPADMTPSMFLRQLICEKLETTRRKDCPTRSWVRWIEERAAANARHERRAAALPPFQHRQYPPYPGKTV